MQLPAGTVLLHRYVIERSLGRGAIGTSHLATDLLRETRVTLKLLHAPRPETVTSLRTEFTLLCGVVHPRLPHVHDFGRVQSEDGSMSYFRTTEYIEGETLNCYAQGRAWSDVVKPIRHALDGLRHLHSLNVRHGDFKPENIIVRPDGAGVLIDLGCSDPIDDSSPSDVTTSFAAARGWAPARAAVTVSGTRGYIAPELLGGLHADHRADLYAVGVTLQNVVGLLAKPAPARVTKLMTRLLRGRPEDRPSDVQEVLDELGAEPSEQKILCIQPARLLGRAAEMAVFEEMLSALIERREGPRGLVVVGPDGVGRTRLLQEMKWAAQLRCTVVEGSALKPSPVLAMLTVATGEKPSAKGIEGLLQARAKLADSNPPIVLILDDAHLAPDADQELIHALLRTLTLSDPILFILSCTSAPSVTSSCVRTATLGPLSAEDVGVWVREIVPARQLKDVYRLTGGYPASLLALISLLPVRGAAVSHLTLLGESALLSERRIEAIRALDPAQRRLLGLIAVLDEPLDVAELSSADGGGAREALVRLMQRGFVQSGTTGFKLVRAGEAPRILELLGREVVASLHRQAAERLRERLSAPREDRGVTSELTARLVQKLSLGGLVDEARSLLLSSRPLYMDAPSAWASAAKSVAVALGGPELFLLAAKLHDSAEQYDHSLGLVASLLCSCPAPSWRSRAWIQAGASYLRRAKEAKRDYQRARQALLRALGGDCAPDDRARAHDLLARVYIRLDRYTEALAYARRGLETASSTEVIADINDSIGLASAYLGDLETASAHHRIAARLHEETGDRRAQARSVDYRAFVEYQAGNTLEMARGYRAAAILAEQDGSSKQIMGAVLNLGAAQHLVGDLGEALSSYERALRMALALGVLTTEAHARHDLSKLYADIGLFERAQAEAERAESVARRAPSEFILGKLAMELGDVTLAHGDVAQAIEHLRRARGVLSALNAKRHVLEAELHLAEAHLIARDYAETEQAILRLTAPSAGSQASDIAGRIAMIQGRLHLAQGRSTRAIDCLDEASRLAVASNQRALQAEVLGWLSAACEREGLTFLAELYKDRSRELWERMAASLPKHLREAFWTHPSRRDARRSQAAPPARGSSAREGRLKLLLDINRALIRSRDMADVLRCALDSAIELMEAQRGFIILAPKEGESGALRVAVARNMDHERITDSYDKFSHGIAEQVIAKREALIALNAEDDPRFAGNDSVHAMRLRSVICVPIWGADRVLGALYLDHRFRRALFTSEDVDDLVGFADQVAIALAKARTNEELARSRDELREKNRLLEQLLQGKVEEADKLSEEVRRAKQELGHRYDYKKIIGESEAMRSMFAKLDRVIGTGLSILLLGETGTGKEIVARAIHENGPRSKKRFVTLDCTTIAESLAESLLFGHTEGAFTDAKGNKEGLIAAADGGTLFIDEIGDMPLRLQSKLLRVLEQRRVRAVGAVKERDVNFHLICATNRPLASDVAEELFRRDLYHRIQQVHVFLPPLRRRKTDIPALAEHFLKAVKRPPNKPPLELSSAALRFLMARSWPGNVREFENAIKAAAALAEGDVITPADLLLALEEASDPSPEAFEAERSSDAEEADRVVAAYEAAGANAAKAAAALKMSKATFYRRIDELGLRVRIRKVRAQRRRT